MLWDYRLPDHGSPPVAPPAGGSWPFGFLSKPCTYTGTNTTEEDDAITTDDEARDAVTGAGAALGGGPRISFKKPGHGRRSYHYHRIAVGYGTITPRLD